MPPAIRRALQRGEESVRVLAKRYGVSPSTVQKWRTRETIVDVERHGNERKSSVLTWTQEAAVVALRLYALPSLDECHAMLQPWIPRLTRSSLHRCLTRYGLSRLPEVRGKATARTLSIYAIELQCSDVGLSAFIAVEHYPPRIVAQFVDEMTMANAALFLDALVQVAKRPIFEVRTRRHQWFTAGVHSDRDRHGMLREHPFERACWRHGIQHSVFQEAEWWIAAQCSAADVLIKEAARQQRQREARSAIARFLSRYNRD